MKIFANTCGRVLSVEHFEVTRLYEKVARSVQRWGSGVKMMPDQHF